ILSTQFSFGRAASQVAERVRVHGGLITRFRAWRAERERNKERQAIVEKHVKRAGKDKAPEISTKVADAALKLKEARKRGAADPDPADRDDDEDDVDDSPRAKPK